MHRRDKAAPMLLLLSLVFSGLHGVAQSAKPIITKVDPPSWFTRLPDSLLLVHGLHLENTSFTLSSKSARITETTISPNGHWAFLTFVTAQAQPQTLQIVATNRLGSTQVSYTLSALRPAAEQPQGFSSADVMYLIMPDRFADGDPANDKLPGFRAPDDRSASRAYHGGDLRGIAQHLDYLQHLGVTTLWTTPLYDNSAGQTGNTYHGYSATDMYAVDPHFGSMADYRDLVAKAHARHMKVILDTVPNHVGPAHPWAADPPTPDWLHGTPDRHIKVKDDYTSVTDPAASETRRHILLDGWFADVLPDLNQDNPLVAQYLIQNAVWWIESAGLDGLRIDTFAYVPRSFWHSYNDFLHRLYPHLGEVGEIFDGDPHITSFWAGGRANAGSDGTFDTLLDTPFDFPLYFALRDALTHRKPISALAGVFVSDALYPHPERLVTFLGNHDTKRFLNEPGATMPALRLAFGLLATMRGMPQLYYGDEIGMAGGDDPDNRRDFPGGFPGDNTDAFASATPSQSAMQTWVRTLLQLRARTPELQSGRQQTLLADANLFAFTRSLEGSSTQYLVVVNNDTAPHVLSLPLTGTALAADTHFTPVLTRDPIPTHSADKLELHLPAEAIIILRAQP